MLIPFVLTADQFAARFRGLLEKHSVALIAELHSFLTLPISKDVTSASVVIFLDEDGETGPSVGIYFDGKNRKVDHSDPSMFPGRYLALAEYVRGLPRFDPQYYSKREFGALDIQADVTKEWFAEWWWKAGGWEYPLPVDVAVHDDYGNGGGIPLTSVS